MKTKKLILLPLLALAVAKSSSVIISSKYILVWSGPNIRTYLLPKLFAGGVSSSVSLSFTVDGFSVMLKVMFLLVFVVGSVK